MEEQLDNYILSHTDPEPAHLRKLGRDVHLRLLYPRRISSVRGLPMPVKWLIR